MPRQLSSEEQERFAAFVETALTGASTEAIERELTDLVVASPFRLRMKVVYSKRDPYVHLHSLAERDSDLRRPYPRRGPGLPKPWSLEQPDRDAPGFILAGAWGRDTIRDFSIPFALLPSTHEAVRYAVTIAKSDEWKQFLRFLDWQYPEIAPIYLTQRELIETIRGYRDSAKGFEVRVREYSAKERRGGGQVHRTVREWTDESLRGIIEQVFERNQAIKSIKLAFYRRLRDSVAPTPSLDAKLTRDGRIEVTGKFQLARENVISRLADVAAEKFELYADRGMRERQYRAAPLRLTFRRKVLAESGEVRRLLGVMKELPHAMYSVQHANPYLHLRIFDGFDGSGFDLWAVTADSLVLMPRLKSSETAIERVISHIFENYREGEVHEVQNA